MQVDPISFEREIALFPLPNCVLFPGVVQPLHIFEPRYRAMMRDVLAGRSLLAMALLKPGWEQRYYGMPAIYPRLCVGRVIAHELLDDGKYNLLLQGLTRADVVSESPREADGGIYRVGILKAATEGGLSEAHENLQRQVLRQMFEKTALRELTVAPALFSLFEEPKNGEAAAPVARLIDALTFSLVQDVEAKQRILEEDNLAARGELLLRQMVALAERLGNAPRKPDWPPQMSMN
jgi:Lon protease-like protein